MNTGLPTPPGEERHHHSSKKGHSSSKVAKQVRRGSAKRSIAHSQPSPTHDSHAMMDARHKRVWKACERCRMKKTKCDGEFPCKRCKDDGLVCTSGTRKKTEFKQLPKGYAEVLENTQFALIATVHKLYAMVRNNQSWDLGEPELNDRGQPVIHNIATKLGCIRPNNDLDLPVHSVFPEDEAGMAELAAQLEEAQQMQQHEAGADSSQSQASSVKMEATDSHSCNRTERSSSSVSDLDHSDFEQDYRRAAFGGGNGSVATLSPQSLTYHDFDVVSTTAASQADAFASQSPMQTSFGPTAWAANRAPMPLRSQQQQYIPQINPAYVGMDLLNQGLLESNFGALKPHVMSCPNPEVMLGMGDPMIYAGYDPDAMRL